MEATATLDRPTCSDPVCLPEFRCEACVAAWLAEHHPEELTGPLWARYATVDIIPTREDDPAKLAALSGVSVEHATRLLPMLKQRDVSLDASMDGETPPVERLPDTSASPESVAIQHADDASARSRIEEALTQLSERERWIVESRVLTEGDVTLESLGQKLGISKERVRQIEARALEKLRVSLSDLAA